MNRTIALFLAIATLLAHTLAIHVDNAGNFGPPYDSAHVAYRVARNFVHAGSFRWDPGLPVCESYPSPLWVLIAAIAERFYFSVSFFSQVAGMAAAMVNVIVLARFSARRLVGVAAPLLSVTSGGIAAAAASGNETCALMLFITAGFLAFERRRNALLALCLGLACLTRPEALLLCAALIAMELVRWIARGKRTPARPLWGLAVPVAVFVAAGFARMSWTGSFWPVSLYELFEPTQERFRRGSLYLADCFLGAGAPLLVVLPIWYTLRGALPGMGVRAWILALVWALAIACSGGGALPMGEALVPVLPVLYVAVQEAMTVALDSRRRGLSTAVWVLFLLGLASSAMASKYPGDLGPLPLERVHRAWMQPIGMARFGYEQKRGRLGLAEEIDLSDRLRSVGIFMRDHLDPSHTVLTPWPGAIGYLSRLCVIDVLGRTTPLPGERQASSWSPSPHADVAKALELQPDYIVPQIVFTQVAPTEQHIAALWIKELDILPRHPRRNLGLLEQLLTYELIAVPIPDRPSRPGEEWTRPFFVMRKQSLGLSPKLSIEVDGDREFRVEVQHRSHEQLVDLRVQILDGEGNRWCLKPSGDFVAEGGILARTRLLLFPSGTRSVCLLTGKLPEHPMILELRAVLRNPGAESELGYAAASEEVVVPIRPGNVFAH